MPHRIPDSFYNTATDTPAWWQAEDFQPVGYTMLLGDGTEIHVSAEEAAAQAALRVAQTTPNTLDLAQRREQGR